MPQVPTYDLPEVRNEMSPDIRGFATPQAFGAGIGQAVSSLGKDVEHVGTILDRRATTLMDMANRADVDEKTSNWIIDQSKLDAEHRSLEGKARADNFENYVQKSKELREKYSNSFGTNLYGKRLFDQDSKRYYSYSIRNEAYGVGTELKKYITDSNKLVVKTANNMVMQDPVSESNFQDALGKTRRAIEQEATNKSWTPEEVEDNRRIQESSLWQTRIATLAQDDPIAAREMFDRNKDKMLPATQREVESALAAGKNKAGSKAQLLSFGFKNALENDIQSIMKTGSGNSDLTDQQVRAVLGDKAYDDWQEARKAASKVYFNTYDLATLPYNEMQERLRTQVPNPNSKDYITQEAVYKATKNAIDTQNKLRDTDPAESVKDDPAVKAAIQSGDQANVIDARLAAQERAGIPKVAQSPITMNEAHEIMRPLSGMLPGSDIPKAFEQVFSKIQKEYGSHAREAFVYALRAEKTKAEAAQIGIGVMENLLKGQAPPPTVVDAARDTNENGAIDSTVNNIGRNDSFNPFGGDYFNPAVTPEKKEPLSKKILDRYPVKNGGR